MILAPKTEWAVIAAEESSATAVFMSYAFPLILASAAAGFIGYTFIWRDAVYEFSWREGVNETAALTWGLFFSIRTLLIGALGVWLVAAGVNAQAKNFGSEKNMGRAMQLVAYAMTPAWLGGIIMIYPPIGIIGLLFGLYGLYLLYLGLPLMMKTPKEKVVTYTVISILMLLGIYTILGFIYRILLWDVIFGTLKNVQINAHPLK
ncbi:MAG: Yip1 family protein [Candidatus Kapaibacterium sp.]